MAKLRTSRTKKPPSGFSQIEPTLNKLTTKLKQAETKSIKTAKKNEALWEIVQINHQISRYIYDLYYTKEAIESELYQWLLKQKYADANLIAKWKKQGYEKLCCLRCIQTNETNHGSTCICRVPKASLSEEQTVQCVTCGCRGCSSGD